MRIAVYGCNFGNYRNELSKGLDKFTFDDNIDYYFFTDNKDLKSKKWKIIQYPLLEGDDIMNSTRWTSKHVKFILPEILHDYDIVIWCDSKIIRWQLKIVKDEIVKLFTGNEYKIINVKHPSRGTIHDELKHTLNLKLENIENGNKFREEIKGRTYTQLVDTCFIIRKTDKETNDLFAHVFDLFKTKGLQRDQNLYNHAIYEMNYSPNNIFYVPSRFSLSV